MRKATLAVMCLVFLSFILSIYFYPQVPEQMAIHWNSQGEVDSYISRLWGLFFIPLVTAGLAVTYLVIPKIDPRKENIEKIRKYYEEFRVIVILFMVVVQLHILLWNTGTQVNPGALLPIGIGCLFYYAGILKENAELNWFIGLRTPWTLSSERVWRKTNRLGGKLFKIAGIAAVFGAFFPELARYFIVVPVIAIVGFSVIYSYVEYQKELKENEQD